MIGLSLGRAHAVARMRDQVVVGRKVETVDPVTLDQVSVIDPVSYEGPARVKFRLVGSVDAASTVASVYVAELHVPVGVTLTQGETVRVVSSADDESLAGREFTVVGLIAAGQVTAHRYEVSAVD